MYDWQHLQKLLEKLPRTEIRVLEVTCDRTQDASWLKNNSQLD